MLTGWRTGHRLERRAARFLKRRGLRVIGRNLRCGQDEIDLLLREGPVVVVVEVRYRRRHRIQADLSVDRAKALRLQRAWRHLARRAGLAPDTSVRFDLILSAADGVISWHKGVLG